MLTLQFVSMGCGISKSTRTITPAAGSIGGRNEDPVAWIKENGVPNPKASSHILPNGHVPVRDFEVKAPAGTHNRAPQEPYSVVTSDESSTCSKPESMKLFDIVGKVTTDTQTVVTETTEVGVNTTEDKENHFTQTDEDDIFLSPDITPKQKHSKGKPSKRRGKDINGDSHHRNNAKEKDTDSVTTKLYELQQLLGPNVFREAPRARTKGRSEGRRPTQQSLPASEVGSDLGSQDGSASDLGLVLPNDLWDGDLEKALAELSSVQRRKSRRIHVAVQTDNDPVTDEAPEFAAKPPNCRKAQLIAEGENSFVAIDEHVLQTPETAKTSLRNLVNYLTAPAKSDLDRVRAFYKWISHNIRYEWRYVDQEMDAEEILEVSAGVCKDYCKIFSEMCRLADIRVKKLHGFAKSYDYRPGHRFQPGEDITHAWNAVFVMGSWRLIDCTWGTGYTDHLGRFQRRLNEHYFLTDPDMFIWTHFPYDEIENHYSRWQLMDTSITLDEFNSLPKVTPHYFDYHLRIRQHIQCPIVFSNHIDIQVASITFMRYKFKLFPRNGTENTNLNRWVFSQLREDRLLASFMVFPPEPGSYYLKLYARPELDILDDQNSNLHNVAMFLLECVKTGTKYLRPFPLQDIPWGPTQAFFDYGLKLMNVSSSILQVHGGRRSIVIELSQKILLTQQLFDGDGMEIKIRPHILGRKDTEKQIKFEVSPPGIGYFKFLLYGIPKPTERGRWKLPLLASFLLDVQSRELQAELLKKMNAQ